MCSPPDPEGGEAGVFTAASCLQGNLTEVPLDLPPSLLSLDMRGNNISRLGDGLAGLQWLQSVDVSSNSLAVLEADDLVNLTALGAVDFSFNAIHTIRVGAFRDLAAVRVLDLSHNQLKSLGRETLLGLGSLQLLNLTGNVISEVSNLTFLYLGRLTTLDLSHNQLHHLPPLVFQGLDSVRTVLLHHNHLLSVTSVFPGLQQLHALDLSHNQLQTLVGDTFVSVPALRSLHLSFNNISQISPRAFGNSTSLGVLDLKANPLQQLDGRLLGDLSRLEALDLSQMPYLRSVRFDALEGAHSLSLLNLSHNPSLSFVHPQLLAPAPRLTVLDLRSDNISALSHVTFHSNPRLAHVYLADNPLLCGCGLAWLTGPAPRHNQSLVTDVDLVRCLLQSNGSSVPVRHVSQEAVQCNNVSLLNVTGAVAARVGSQLLLRCDHEADETGVLTWVTPRGRTFHYHPFHPHATSHLVDEQVTRDLGGPFHSRHWWHWEGGYRSDLQYSADHILLLADGSLYVDYVLRTDAGPYRCTVHNWHHNQSATVTVRLDYSILFEVKVMSMVVGLACAVTFFTLNAVYVIIMWGARKLVNKRRRERIHHLLESLDDYRTSQIARIRTNYSSQLNRIRDHYHSQSMRLKEHYSTQMKRVRRGCSNQVERIRDNYHARLTQLKEYSSHQIQQIRDATNNQIMRIRDYGSLQMERLRETYKLQQQHVMKVMEAMNLENCRTVVETECLRTESMMLDMHFPELDVDDNTSTEEASSQHSHNDSVYATALNSDRSSVESLATVVKSDLEDELLAEDVTIEVLPSDPPPGEGCGEPLRDADSLSDVVFPLDEVVDELDVCSPAGSDHVRETVV